MIKESMKSQNVFFGYGFALRQPDHLIISLGVARQLPDGRAAVCR